MSRTGLAHTEALETQDQRPDGEEEKKKKSRRPANTAFRQQRLKAWQPILTPKTVLPLFFIVGIIFAPIGGLLLYASAQVEELVIDYSNCHTEAPEGTDNFSTVPEGRWHATFKTSNATDAPTWSRTDNHERFEVDRYRYNTTLCHIQFHIPTDIGPAVFLYYRLTNFYQNHRRYVKSLDLDQLKGKAVSNGTIGGSSCDPLRLDPNGKAYYPCGLIANSLFNDSFSEPRRVGSSDNEIYEMTNRSISWGSDRDLFKPTTYAAYDVSPPPNWELKYPTGYNATNPPPDIQAREDIQVWMRTAGLPTFSKLARRNDDQVMTAGTYQLDIEYNFPVSLYGGTKSIVITTTTVMGGKNPFMGIAYVVVGGICIVLGAVFTVAHLIKPRKLGDHTYLTWNNEQPTGPAGAAGSSTGVDSRLFGRT